MHKIMNGLTLKLPKKINAMEEQLVSIETGILAHEKGFRDYTYRTECSYRVLNDVWEQDHHNGNDFLMYTEGEIITSHEEPSHYGLRYEFTAVRPPQSALHKWLRDNGIHFLCPMYSRERSEYDALIDNKIVPFKTYEECLEALIFNALKGINP